MPCFIISCKDTDIATIQTFLVQLEFVNIQTCFWYKDNVKSEGGHRLVSSVEVIILCWKKSQDSEYWNFGKKVRQRHNLLQFPLDTPYRFEGQIANPCQKPVKLMKYFLDHFCRPGGFVLDICGGTGSMAIACLEFGANYLYVDIKEEMTNCAIRRLKEQISLKDKEERKVQVQLIQIEEEQQDEGFCKNCGSKTQSKCENCFLFCCAKCVKMIDNKQMCSEKCEGPPPRCGRCNKFLGLEPLVTCTKCTAQIHKSCVPKNKEAVCMDKCKGNIRAYATQDFEKALTQ